MKRSPVFTAGLSQAVYKINEGSDLREVLRELNAVYGDNFSFQEETLKGKFGIGFAKVKTHSGLLILGKNNLKGHAFIVFRGTDLLVDWGSNIDIATKSTGSGLVHSGFYKAMNSTKDQVRAFVLDAQKQGVVHFHCIGHSLGGAIATLCADWLKSAFNISSYVYTFGAPRPGLEGFAKKFTKNIGEQRIYRVFHTGDVVPYIAPWPFTHAPLSNRVGRISAGGNIPSVEWHSMKKYIDSVKAHSWDTLMVPAGQVFNNKELEDWMLSTKPDATGVSLSFIEKVGAAIKHLMVNVLKVALSALTIGIGSAFTWYDFVAYVFKKSIQKSSKAAELVLGLMNKMLRAMGLGVVADTTNLTRDKMRNVFLTFTARMNHLVYQAVNSTLADGKGI